MTTQQTFTVPTFVHDAHLWFTQLEASALGRSRDACFAALESIQLDERRPSQLLTAMQDLNRAAGSPISDAMLRFRHTRLMPAAIRLQLASVRGELTLSEYAELVDAVFDAHSEAHLPPTTHPPPPRYSGPSPALVSEVSRRRHLTQPQDDPRPPGHPAAAAAALPDATLARLARVEEALCRLQADLRPYQRSSDGLCYYHARFGEAARNCRAPCIKNRHTSSSGNGLRGGRLAL